MLGDVQKDLLLESEFADEYQEWLLGTASEKRAGWFDYPVRKLARSQPLCVPSRLSVLETVQRMSRANTGSALVMDGTKLVGIFTERDLLQRVVSNGADAGKVSVADVMTQAPEVLPSSATLAQAMRLLANGHYRHAPIVDERGNPVGMLGIGHILAFVSETFPKEILNSPPEKSRISPRVQEGA